MTPVFDLDMEQGETFEQSFNWYAGGKFMARIEEVEVGYPTIIKVTNHGLPSVSMTPVIISGVMGCEILNSSDLGIELATYIDADHFSMPISTVADTWKVNTGEITYHKPTDITDYTARMHIREKWHSTTFIHELTTENGGIVLDVNDASIGLSIDAATTALFTFNKAFYDIEMVSPVGTVTKVIKGTITLYKEITK